MNSSKFRFTLLGLVIGVSALLFTNPTHAAPTPAQIAANQKLFGKIVTLVRSAKTVNTKAAFLSTRKAYASKFNQARRRANQQKNTKFNNALNNLSSTAKANFSAAAKRLGIASTGGAASTGTGNLTPAQIAANRKAFGEIVTLVNSAKTVNTKAALLSTRQAYASKFNQARRNATQQNNPKYNKALDNLFSTAQANFSAAAKRLGIASTGGAASTGGPPPTSAQIAANQEAFRALSALIQRLSTANTTLDLLNFNSNFDPIMVKARLTATETKNQGFAAALSGLREQAAATFATAEARVNSSAGQKIRSVR